MSKHRSSSKKPVPEIGLHMECEEEELEPSQLAFYKKAENEYKEVQAKLDKYIENMKYDVIEKRDNCLVLELVTKPSASKESAAQVSTPVTSKITWQTNQQATTPGVSTRSTASTVSSPFVVVDPKIGQVESPNSSTEQLRPTDPSKVTVARTRLQTTGSGSVMVTRGKTKALSSPSARTREKTRNQAQQSPQQALTASIQSPVYLPVTTSSSGNYKIRSDAKPVNLQSSKPNENNAVGGLSAGTKTLKTGTEDSSSKSAADSKEVTLNKVSGKIFPSLVVVARPNLKFKFIPQYIVQTERSALDAKVKGVLMYSSTKFIEWLIQQGLIRSEQHCQIHLNNDLTPVKLKLGMYSDVSKFPYSGGYVWISDCCPQQFVSVFAGSIFEGAPHPPTTLLKLIYHWACQTNVQNVVQWVKVNNLYLKNFYTNMRAVCTQAIHEKYKKMGGPRKKIEVGVISLGTTSQDGVKRQVKVEVLGVMDHENKLIRLRAVDPLTEERSFKRRFVKILEPLEEWVDKDSTILIDFTVAKAALNMMGFSNVYQVTNDSKYSNHNVMEYLRKVVPVMFQNTLSLLSRQIIQQFLDELVWREIWGPIPSQAFVNIIAHIAEQTKLDVLENFLVRLNKVAGNPFKKWDYSVWIPSLFSRSGSKPPQPAPQESTSETDSESKGIRTRKRTAEMSIPETITLPSSKKVARVPAKEKSGKKESGEKITDETAKVTDEGEKIPLEKYYYGLRYGSQGVSTVKGPFSVKCCVCNKKFTNNIVLMKHIILHSQLQPVLNVDLKKVQQCEYCFLGFNTSANLKTHLQEVHSVVDGKLNNILMCHICEVKYGNRSELLYHMHKRHVELEMPYECGACRFRTSIYKCFVDHFLRDHQGEEHVFCPYCLKVVAFSYKGEAITSNVLFYMAHLEKHLRMSLVKECDRCQLSFIHKGILDQHVEADHGSWKNEPGVEFPEHIPTGIMMSAPDPAIMIKLPVHTKTPKIPKSRNSSFVVSRFKSLEIYGLDEDMACAECEGSLTFSEHFTGVFSCLKCRFSSCCEKALTEHIAIFHECKPVQFTKGKPIVLPQEMFCACGYSTSSGNRMAKHLGQCERETAYMSKETATATLKSLKTGEKAKPEGQNVLNLLGLVRKSPEASAETTAETSKKTEDLEIESKVEPDVSRETDVKQEVEDVKPMKDEVIEQKVEEEETDTSESKTEPSVIANPEAKDIETNAEPKEDTKTEKFKEIPMDIVEEKIEENMEVDYAEVSVPAEQEVEALNEELDKKETESVEEVPKEDEDKKETESVEEVPKVEEDKRETEFIVESVLEVSETVPKAEESV